MLRFTLRDVLCLTAVIGLAIAWRLEIQSWRTSRQTLKKFEVIADEAALASTWQIVQITSSGVTTPVSAANEASMRFDSGYWDLRYSGNAETWEYKLIRPGEINFDSLTTPGGFKATWKWRYELKDGKLWMIRSNKPGDRPSDFDATNDPSLTLYELRKVELEPKPPAQQPQPAAGGTEI